MSVCPNGHPVLDESKEFCGECGARVVHTCSNGHALRPGARFCPVWGETIAASGQPAPHQAAERPPASRPTATSRNTVPWILGAVALVVVIVLAVILFARHPGTTTAPTTTPPTVTTPSTTTVQPLATASSQVAVINHLLQSAPQDRAELQNAVDVIQSSIDASNGSCSVEAVNAVSEIKTVANGREDLLIQLSAISMSQVPGGERVLEGLRNAWTISLQIDRAFGQWSKVELQNGCSVSDSAIPSYHTTAILDPQSTAIKTRFVEEWNPIASQYGLPSDWSADQI
jgi:hypothetical protein